MAYIIKGKACIGNRVHCNRLHNGIGTAVVVGYHQFNVVGAGSTIGVRGTLKGIKGPIAKGPAP